MISIRRLIVTMGGDLPMEFLTQWKQITSEMLIIHNPGGNENKVMAEHASCPELWPPTRNGPQGSSGLSQRRPGWLASDSNRKPHGKAERLQRNAGWGQRIGQMLFWSGYLSALIHLRRDLYKGLVHALSWLWILPHMVEEQTDTCSLTLSLFPPCNKVACNVSTPCIEKHWHVCTFSRGVAWIAGARGSAGVAPRWTGQCSDPSPASI